MEAEANDDNDVPFGFKVQVEPIPQQPNAKVTIRWIKGHDQVLFESFCGMLKRKVEGITLAQP